MMSPPVALARGTFRRRRPVDPLWPSSAAWRKLASRIRGRLVPLHSPFDACRQSPSGSACTDLFKNVRNPYYIGGNPALTQTLGWVDAWTSRTSVYAVEALDATDVAAAVNFARENDLRLVVKGGGHSYLGTSNAPDSLLIWTRRMNDIAVGADSVTLGAGCIWLHAYDAVTTEAGRYVQGGGCTTVGVAGLIQSGGFGSFSKHYGSAASSLLEAEVVTADGEIRVANATTNPDLFWALKGGGGGTFGVVTKLTLRLHDLPEYFGGASFTVKASSEPAFQRLVDRTVEFYAEHLYGDAWGEQVAFRHDNSVSVNMVCYGLSTQDARASWKPYLDWIAANAADYALDGDPVILSGPARQWWNADFLKQCCPHDFVTNHLPDALPGEFWWSGDSDQVGQFLWGYESLWLPASLLEQSNRAALSGAIFNASRHRSFALHMNKGLAGAPAGAVTATRDTATNPSVCSSFALVISASGQEPSYPGVIGHEPDVATARARSQAIRECMKILGTVAPQGGSYVSESNFFELDWQQSYWGANYARLSAVKKKYDPDGLFFVHHGVGSEAWSDDGFTRMR